MYEVWLTWEIVTLNMCQIIYIWYCGMEENPDNEESPMYLG